MRPSKNFFTQRDMKKPNNINVYFSKDSFNFRSTTCSLLYGDHGKPSDSLQLLQDSSEVISPRSIKKPNNTLINYFLILSDVEDEDESDYEPDSDEDSQITPEEPTSSEEDLTRG